MRECLRLTAAGAVSITGRILWCREVEQLARSRDVLGASAVGEETVVTDAVETVGQDVDEEAADELVGVKRHKLVARRAGVHPMLVKDEIRPICNLPPDGNSTRDAAPQDILPFDEHIGFE
jgi:hypothetical protein